MLLPLIWTVSPRQFRWGATLLSPNIPSTYLSKALLYLPLTDVQWHCPRKQTGSYRKNSKIWDTSNNCHNCPKNRKVWCNISLMHPKVADGMANSVDPDQTASSEAVWSWSALFAETYLSQYIEFIRYKNCQALPHGLFIYLEYVGYLNGKLHSSAELQIRGGIRDNSKIIFFYFSMKTYVVTPH